MQALSALLQDRVPALGLVVLVFASGLLALALQSEVLFWASLCMSAVALTCGLLIQGRKRTLILVVPNMVYLSLAWIESPTL